MKIELTPDPSCLMESLKNIGYTIETALADIIDNSVAAGARKISVRFSWNNGIAWVAIIDDGHGMSPDKLRDAMRWGSQSPNLERASHDLGRFGLGMKTASVAYCRELTVSSRAEGHPLSACVWDLDNADGWRVGLISSDDISGDMLLNQLAGAFLGATGTIVLWRNLQPSLLGTRPADRERKFNEMMNSSRQHISTVFHRFIAPTPGKRKIAIDFNNQPLDGFDPFGPEHPARMEMPEEIIPVHAENTGDGTPAEIGSIRIKAYVLPHRNKVGADTYERYAGEEGYLQNQGLYIYRNERLIVKSTWLRLRKKEELSKLVRVKIDFPNSLDHLWELNINKSQVTLPEVVKERLRQVLDRIANLGKEVYNRRAARLIEEAEVNTWKRVAREGKSRYTVNEDHELVRAISEELSPQSRVRLKALLRLIAAEFPYEICHNDVANDTIDQQSESTLTIARELGRERAQSLQECGLTPDEIREQLCTLRIPGLDEATITEIIHAQINN